MYGLYHSTRPMRSRNQTPHSVVFTARTRLTAGLAASTSTCHVAPLQNSMAKKIPMNTNPVPRSGCAMISSHGMRATKAGFHKSTSDFGEACRAENTLASMRTTAIFASSEGWPSLTPPTASQLCVAVPVLAPLPTKRRSSNTAFAAR